MDIQLPKNLPRVKITSANIIRPQYSWIEVILLVIVIVLGWFFTVSPKKAEYNQRQEIYKEAVSQEEAIAGEVATLKQLVQTMKNSSKQMANLDEGLPLSGRATRLQMLLNNLAQSSGIAVLDVNISKIGESIVAGNVETLKDPFAADRSVQKMSAAMSLTGTFEQLQAFLLKLESSGRILDVSTFEIANGESGNLNMRIVLDAYYFGTN